MYNPRGEHDISSHALDLLQLSAEDMRRQRGVFAAHDLSQDGLVSTRVGNAGAWFPIFRP